MDAAKEFAERTASLLRMERDAEVEEEETFLKGMKLAELEKRGRILRKLAVAYRTTGAFGRTVIVFQSARSQGSTVLIDLPVTRMGSGDIVAVSEPDAAGLRKICSGVITRITSARVFVAFDDPVDDDELPDGQLVLSLITNDITYKRLTATMAELQTHAGPGSRLINILFGDALPAAQPIQEIFPANANLNETQRHAVAHALAQSDIAVIHGPPGTGKTTTVVELIVQHVRQGRKILACAPSNIAVDNIVERLVRYKIKVVRIGHPARLLESIQDYSLDAMLQNADSTQLAADVRKDMEAIQKKLTAKTKDKAERSQLRFELRDLRRELRKRENDAVQEILKHADVVLGTTTSISTDGPLRQVPSGFFDVAIVDEAGQALEAACWVALLQAPR